MLNDSPWEGTYILPPNNGNIPRIPLIVEEGWIFGGSPYFDEDANVIALFGNTSQQVLAANIGSTDGGSTPVPNLSTFVQFQSKWYETLFPQSVLMLKSAVTDQYLNYTNFNGVYVYSYLIVNSTYVEAGYYNYNPNTYIVWIPITLLDTYSVNNNGRTYFTLNYNPFQYGTLEIGAGDGSVPSSQGVEWVVARAYPPNGVMPSIYIG